MTPSKFTKPDSPTQPSSNRKFGLLFSATFALVGFSPLALGRDAPLIWALAVAAAALTFVIVAPDLLEPLHKIWTRWTEIILRRRGGHDVRNPHKQPGADHYSEK